MTEREAEDAVLKHLRSREPDRELDAILVMRERDGVKKIVDVKRFTSRVIHQASTWLRIAEIMGLAPYSIEVIEVKP